MAETSGLWTTSGAPAGHQVASYTQALASDMLAIAAACSGFEGVAPGYLSELAPSSTGANNVRIATGGAMVDGKYYKNSANIDTNIISAVGGGNTRIDRIVIRCTWADFHAEVHLLSGTDAAVPSAPAITQTSGTTYDIQICQVLVNTAGAITITDERNWAAHSTNGIDDLSVTLAKMAANSVDATKIVNRARSFLVIPQYDDLTIDSKGLYLVDGADTWVYGWFYVPSDFASGMTAKAILYCASSGNIYSSNGAVYGATGEAYNAHTDTVAIAAVAITANIRAAIQTITFSAIAAGDFVGLFYRRDASSGTDTLNTNAYIIGWLVEYTADS